MKTNTMLLVVGIVYVIINHYIMAEASLPPEIIVQPEKLYVFRYEDTIVLKCEASGTPFVDYWWKKNGHELDLSQDNLEADPYVTGTLTIKLATSLDEGYYQCFATNQYGTAMSQKSEVKKAMLNSPAETQLREFMLPVGSPMQLQCGYARSYPPEEYHWVVATAMDDANPVEINLDERIQIDTWGNLLFANVKKEDEQGGNIYKCYIHNPFVGKTVSGGASKITVMSGKPPSTQFKTPSHGTGLLGKEFRLKCLFAGDPTPDVIWTRIDGTLPEHRHEFADFGTSLVIKDVGKHDEGTYRCTGSNIHGMVEHTFHLNVEASPVFHNIDHQPHSMNKTEGDSATFVCNATAEPKAYVRWFKNGEPLRELNPRMVISSDGKELTINNLCKYCDGGLTDMMVIQCNASNTHGYAYGEGYLNIIDSPDQQKRLP